MSSFEPTKTAARIGDILRDCGMVTADELDRALAVATKEGIRLGEALVRLGVLTEDQLTWALGIQFDLSFVDINPEMIDWDLLSSLPLDRLVEARLLPLTIAEGVVLTVIADPTVPAVGEVLRALFPRHRVVVQLAAEDAILSALEEARARRGAAARPMPAKPETMYPPRWMMPSAGPRLIDQWIEELAAIRGEGVVAVCPSSKDAAQCDIVLRGAAKPSDIQSIPVIEFDRVLENLGRWFPRTESFEAGFFTLPALSGSGTGAAMRAGVIEGLGRRLLVVESLADEPPPPGIRSVVLLRGRGAARLKGLALLALATDEGMASAVGAIALESRVDFQARGVFQSEIATEAARLRACRWVAASVRPRAILIELESIESAARIAAETRWPGSGAILAVVRDSPAGGNPAERPPGIETLALADEDAEAVASIRERIDREVAQ